MAGNQDKYTDEINKSTAQYAEDAYFLSLFAFAQHTKSTSNAFGGTSRTVKDGKVPISQTRYPSRTDIERPRDKSSLKRKDNSLDSLATVCNVEAKSNGRLAIAAQIDSENSIFRIFYSMNGNVTEDVTSALVRIVEQLYPVAKSAKKLCEDEGYSNMTPESDMFLTSDKHRQIEDQFLLTVYMTCYRKIRETLRKWSELTAVLSADVPDSLRNSEPVVAFITELEALWATFSSIPDVNKDMRIPNFEREATIKQWISGLETLRSLNSELEISGMMAQFKEDKGLQLTRNEYRFTRFPSKVCSIMNAADLLLRFARSPNTRNTLCNYKREFICVPGLMVPRFSLDKQHWRDRFHKMGIAGAKPADDQDSFPGDREYFEEALDLTLQTLHKETDTPSDHAHLKSPGAIHAEFALYMYLHQKGLLRS